MIQAVWEFLGRSEEIWYPLFLGCTALIETLFPPFPGDVVFVALSGLGWQAGQPWWVLWLPGLAGCMVSTVILDSLGRSDGLERLERVVIGASRKNGLARAKRALARRGTWVLAASRFIPGIRSLLVIAASSSGVPRSTVILFAGVSAAVWYGILTAAGYFAGATLGGAEEFMKGFTAVLWTVLAAIVAAGALVVFLRVRRAGR